MTRDGRPVELTRTEFLLLELLMNHPRQVLTRGQIFEHVWGYDFGPSSNSLEVYVGYLRRKLGEPRRDPDGARRRLRPARAVSFRRRLALSCGAAVAVAVVLGCGFAYWIVRDTLRDQIDNSLLSQVRNLATRPPMAADEVMAGEAGEPGRARPDDRVLLTEEAPVFIRILRTERRCAPLPDNLQRDPELEAVARHEREPFFADREIDGHPRARPLRTPSATASRSSPRAR